MCSDKLNLQREFGKFTHSYECWLASLASLGLEPGHMEEGDPCVRGGVGALPSEKDREKIQALSCRKA
jgi:hypothetical protein